MARIVNFVNNAQEINFTRAYRRQLYTIDLAATLLIHIKPEQFSNTEPLKQAENAMIDAFKAINPYFPSIPISAKNEKRFKRQELKIREILSTCVIESKKITPDILNAMLLLAKKAQNEARKGRNKKLIDAWDRLIESLNNIFEQADPSLSNNKWGSLGLNLASSIERAMEI